MITAGEEFKACCAAAYAGGAARFLLGDSFHPGGTALTRSLVRWFQVTGGATIVDVASGRGSSAIVVAQELGCSVVGVDLARDNVFAARSAAADAGLSRVRFVEGDAESLPLSDESADGALCECSLCLFPDKQTAVSELSRVLRPGTLLVLTDVTADPGRLPAELTGLAAWAACIADARPLVEIATLIEAGGFVVELEETHDDLLLPFVARVEARLRLARVLRRQLPSELVTNVERGLELAAAARGAIADGTLGYAAVVARRRS